MAGRPDVAVVGAGILGLASAFHLAERSAGRIVVYERDGIGAGASGVQPGGVRQQWATRVNCLLAQRALQFYRHAAERLDSRANLRFDACGYLFVAHEPATLERLRTDVALQNELGIPSRIVTAGRAADLVPGLTVDAVAGASWCGEDGYFDRPQAVNEAFAEAARRLGVEIERAEVTAVERGPTLHFADGSRTDAEAVVVTAGADTARLVRSLTELPLEREERSVFLSEPINERLLEPLVVAPDRHFAAKQLADGRVLAADLSEPERRVARAHVRVVVSELLPRLEFVTFPLVIRGTYDMTPDAHGIVDAIDRQGRVVVAAGFDGHGFMLAPEIGRGVAAIVAGEDPGSPFEELRADRFAAVGRQRESRVI
ncbi:MAG TPA: FAD-binding oxidoreductase [Gaiellaceae bacterium]|nr:FAD-binding oxidoreductase [Gaiellaceae bacterium]